MTKKNEKEMVKIADREIKKFIGEWKKKPYLWESETDIHAEIYIRIKKMLHTKFPIVEKYQYEKTKKEEYLDWIYCTPTKGKVKKGKRTWVKPDIAIFRYVKNKRNSYIKDKLIWICEIKYATDWAGTLVVENVKSDVRKLKYFLNRKKGESVKACYLILRRCYPLSESVGKILEKIDKRRICLHHDEYQNEK